MYLGEGKRQSQPVSQESRQLQIRIQIHRDGRKGNHVDEETVSLYGTPRSPPVLVIRAFGLTQLTRSSKLTDTITPSLPTKYPTPLLIERAENKISENSVATKQRGNAVPTLSDPQQGMYQSNVISDCDSSVPFRTGLLAITSINPPQSLRCRAFTRRGHRSAPTPLEGSDAGDKQTPTHHPHHSKAPNQASRATRGTHFRHARPRMASLLLHPKWSNLGDRPSLDCRHNLFRVFRVIDDLPVFGFFPSSELM